MKTPIIPAGMLMMLSAGLVSFGGWGCAAELLQNQTAPLSGNISVGIVNDTSFRASFTIGTYNDLQRNPPGVVNFNQNRLAAGLSSAASSLPCGRNLAIGTAKLLQRVLDTNGDQSTANFDEGAFSVTVNFSDAPDGSDLEAVATVGTAVGLDKLVGVDFSCGDELIFTFRRDPDAEGGFRIDFQLIHDDQ